MLSKISYPSITPGRITAVWLVLQVARKYQRATRSEIEAIASATSLRGGGLPISEGLALAELIGYLKFLENCPRLSSDGWHLSQLSDSEEPSPLVVREIALLLAKRIRPPWIAFSDPKLPIEERRVAIPEGWQEVLEDAGLFDMPPSREVQEWWDSIHMANEILLDELKSKIGRKGEELTMAFEKARLEDMNRRDLASRVILVSEKDDRFGFDVASFAAGIVPGLEEEAPIMVEVKSSTSTSRKGLAFELTRNEWDVAERNERVYFFHFWQGISFDEFQGNKQTAFGPFTLRADSLTPYIPSDSPIELGRWTKCHIELDIGELFSKFVRTA